MTDRIEQTRTLVAQARAGDREAFEALVRLHYRTIHRWALVGTGDPDDADDVTQRVLILIHRKLGSLRESARFDAWLYRITGNAVREHFRRRTSRGRAMDRYRLEEGEARDSEHLERTPSERLADDRAAELVKAFFRELPVRQREVFDLVELQGLKAAEAARLLGLEASTVRVQLLRARRTIRAKILDRYPALAEDYT